MDDKNSSGDHIKRFVRVYKNKKEFFSSSEILLQLIYNENWVSYTPTRYNTKLHVISPPDQWIKFAIYNHKNHLC